MTQTKPAESIGVGELSITNSSDREVMKWDCDLLVFRFKRPLNLLEDEKMNQHNMWM